MVQASNSVIVADCSDNQQMYQLGLLLTPEALVIVRGRPTVFMLILSPFIFPVAELLSFLFGAGSKAWHAYQAKDITGLQNRIEAQFCSFIPRSAIREVRCYRGGGVFSIKVDKKHCTFGRRSRRLPRWFKQCPGDTDHFRMIFEGLQASESSKHLKANASSRP